MTLEALKKERLSLILQRAALRDQVESCEKQLDTLAFAIKVLEENSKPDNQE